MQGVQLHACMAGYPNPVEPHTPCWPCGRSVKGLLLACAGRIIVELFDDVKLGSNRFRDLAIGKVRARRPVPDSS